MGVEFLTPAFLAGILAAAIPVVIHLIHRRRSTIRPIATLRFLRQIPARTIRRRRLEEYILLAARALLIALLALGAARPVLTSAGVGGATSMVVVLDDSWSMEYRVGGVTRMQDGVEAALNAFRTLKDGDRAALVKGSAPESETLTRDLADLRRRAGTVRVAKAGGDLLPALTKAFALLREAPEPNREAVLVTDLQQRAVLSIVERLREEDEDRAVRVVLVDVGSPEAVNAGLLSVRAGSGVAIAGEPVRVSATVKNHSAKGITTRVSLMLGEERVAERQVVLDPGEQSLVSFRITSDVPGAESGQVFLAGDALPGDDVRHFALPVLGRIPVLLVNGDPSPVAYQDETFFLRAALAPEEMGAKMIASPVHPTTVAGEDLADQDLSPYRVVLLANVGELSTRDSTRLRAFVRTGGGLLVFAGNRVDPEGLNAALGADAENGLLPALLSAAEALGAGADDVMALGTADLDHPIFADLPAKALEDLNRIHARRILRADPRPSEGRVLASLGNGAPLILSRSAGRGRVVLLTVTADADWGNLPLRPIFLPLLHRTVQHLAGGGTTESDHLLGDTVAIPRPSSDAPPPEVTDPRSELTRVGDDLAYGPLTLAGVYRIASAGETHLFAANADPAEGDLSRVPVEHLRDLFGERRFTVHEDPAAVGATMTSAREGRPIWGYLLAAALLLLLFEAFFANRIAAARAAGRKEVA